MYIKKDEYKVINKETKLDNFKNFLKGCGFNFKTNNKRALTKAEKINSKENWIKVERFLNSDHVLIDNYKYNNINLKNDIISFSLEDNVFNIKYFDELKFNINDFLSYINNFDDIKYKGCNKNINEIKIIKNNFFIFKNDFSLFITIFNTQDKTEALKKEINNITSKSYNNETQAQIKRLLNYLDINGLFEFNIENENIKLFVQHKDNFFIFKANFKLNNIEKGKNELGDTIKVCMKTLLIPSFYF